MRDRVLFVDDEASILDGFRRSLHDQFSVSTAIGGEEGLADIRVNGPFAVVVSDMRMPGMDGAQFLAHVRERAPDSVRILLTGYADLNTAIDAVNRGSIFRFLTKPCPRPILVDAIRKGLEQHHATLAEKELLKKASMIERLKSEWDNTDIYQSSGVKVAGDLPGPAEARSALQASLGANSQVYVVLLKITLLRTVEERYGEKAADAYLKKRVQFLTQALRPDDRFFFWSRDVLMALVERKVGPVALRMEISRLMLDNNQEIVDLDGRKVMIATSMAFDLFPLARFSTLDDLLLAFDAKLIGRL